MLDRELEILHFALAIYRNSQRLGGFRKTLQKGKLPARARKPRSCSQAVSTDSAAALAWGGVEVTALIVAWA